MTSVFRDMKPCTTMKVDQSLGGPDRLLIAICSTNEYTSPTVCDVISTSSTESYHGIIVPKTPDLRKTESSAQVMAYRSSDSGWTLSNILAFAVREAKADTGVTD
jgi:hypothetical protein